MLHIILLILGEVWSKGSNFTSSLFVNVFAKVAEVNAEALKGTVIQISQYMIASTQITNTETFAFIAVLVFKLMSSIVLFTKRKDIRNW